jgi:hypothetical protein
VILKVNSGINLLTVIGWQLLFSTELTLMSKTSSLLDSGTNFLNTLIVTVEMVVLIKVNNAMTDLLTLTLLLTSADSTANSHLAVMELRTDLRSVIREF